MAVLDNADAVKNNKNKRIVVVLDPGHGDDDPGAVNGGLKERDLNLKIAMACYNELKEYPDIEVYSTRMSNSEEPTIKERVNYAASVNADILVSIHINSSTSSSANGAEVWTPNANYNKIVYQEGQAISNSIQKELTALGLADRGVKMSYSKDNTRYADGTLADYYGIIRESKKLGFVGIIVEHAFISNSNDRKYLSNDDNLKTLGLADAQGIVNYYGVTKGTWEETADGRKYRYADGSYAIGYTKIKDSYYYFSDSGIMKTFSQIINGEPYYFESDGKGAKKRWINTGGNKRYSLGNGKLATGTVKINGVYYEFAADGYCIDKTASSNYTIAGSSAVTVNQMVAYYKAKRGDNYPDTYKKTEASTIEKFCQIYYNECKTEGIKAEVAFCQAMKETGWLKFGGDVKITQYNFAGIGATGGGNPGYSFDSVTIGVRAHVQHLKAYANKDKLVNECVDPRFDLVKRGAAPYVQWLGQKANPDGYGWAPAATYGTDIVEMITELKTH